MLQESFRGAADPWLPWNKRLQAGEYNRTPKVLRKNRGETLREAKTFKSSHEYGKNLIKTTHTSPGKLYA